jgi:hypothetical protein
VSTPRPQRLAIYCRRDWCYQFVVRLGHICLSHNQTPPQLLLISTD